MPTYLRLGKGPPWHAMRVALEEQNAMASSRLVRFAKHTACCATIVAPLLWLRQGQSNSNSHENMLN